MANKGDKGASKGEDPKKDVGDEIQSERADVGTRETKLHEESKKRKIIAAVIGVVAIVLIYNMFSEEFNNQPLSQEEKIERVEKLAEEAEPLIIEANDKTLLPPTKPELPDLEVPELPPPPPAPSLSELNIPSLTGSNIPNILNAPPTFGNPPPNTFPSIPPQPINPIGIGDDIGGGDLSGIEDSIPPITTSADEFDDVNLAAFGIIGGGGRGGSKGGARGSGGGVSGSGIPSDFNGVLDDVSNKIHDKEQVDESQPLKRTAAPQVRATLSGNLSRMIRQGKIIQVTLENAINTQLQGKLRGIVNTDVYAEAGTNILIPKGSRVMGTYVAPNSLTGSRISIIWDRIMRPDGVEIAPGAPGVDQLGRLGVEGNLDNKFLEAMASAFLTSIIPVAGNVVANSVFGEAPLATTTTSSTPTGPSVSRTESSFLAGIKDGINTVSEKMQSVVSQYTENNQPVITINQGAKIQILVEKDLIF